MLKYILPFKARVGALLGDNDKARTAFNVESIKLEENINKHVWNRVFYAMLFSAFVTSVIMASCIYIVQKANASDFMSQIETAIKATK